MEEKELNTIVSWIINRKCKRDDNIHIKRVVKPLKQIINITKLEKEEIIDILTKEIWLSSKKYLYNLESPFPYVSKIIYDSALPTLLDNHIQAHILEQEELNVESN